MSREVKKLLTVPADLEGSSTTYQPEDGEATTGRVSS
jgi:hypothetical protein